MKKPYIKVFSYGKFVPAAQSLQVTERRKIDKYGTDKKSCTT